MSTAEHFFHTVPLFVLEIAPLLSNCSMHQQIRWSLP